LARGDEIALCIPIPEDGCLREPEHETVLGLALTVDLQIPTGRVFRPFVSLGPAYQVITGSPLPGARGQWLTYDVETGLRALAFGAQCGLSVRWRRNNRWSSSGGTFSERALILSVRSGSRF
jgi:hypothetical protein